MLEGSSGLADDLATPPRAKRGRISLQQDTPEPEMRQDEDWEQWEPPQLVRKERKRLSHG